MTRVCECCGQPLPGDEREAQAYGLTHRQREALDYIGGYIASRGVAPSYDEIIAALGVRSKGVAHRLVEALVERGHIRRLRSRGRSITLVRPQ